MKTKPTLILIYASVWVTENETETCNLRKQQLRTTTGTMLQRKEQSHILCNHTCASTSNHHQKSSARVNSVCIYLDLVSRYSNVTANSLIPWASSFSNLHKYGCFLVLQPPNITKFLWLIT